MLQQGNGTIKTVGDRISYSTIAISVMTIALFQSLAETLVKGMSPVLAVVVFFIVGYVIIGIPLQFTRGPGYRDAWGTVGGIFAALMYLTILFVVYPDFRGPAASHSPTQKIAH
jgi:hypothetical protein